MFDCVVNVSEITQVPLGARSQRHRHLEAQTAAALLTSRFRSRPFDARPRVHERPTASAAISAGNKTRRRLHRRSPSSIESCIFAHEGVDRRADASVLPRRRAWRPWGNTRLSVRSPVQKIRGGSEDPPLRNRVYRREKRREGRLKPASTNRGLGRPA